MKRVLAIGMLLLALTGCGTVQNFTDGWERKTRPYGGVKIAAAQFSGDLVAIAMMWPFYAADVVFSAVGDTATLPVTVPLAVANAINHRSRPMRALSSQSPSTDRSDVCLQAAGPG